jgi:hypothetical protein
MERLESALLPYLACLNRIITHTLLTPLPSASRPVCSAILAKATLSVVLGWVGEVWIHLF